MGNSFGSRRKAVKVMKVDGTVLRFKPPVTANEALREHPGHVLLDSEDVKRLGIRSPHMEPDKLLKPKKVYFLVELPKQSQEQSTPSYARQRRVQSGVHMSAKDRLETLMLKRRAESDITSLIREASIVQEVEDKEGGKKVRVRLPKSQVARLVHESGNSTEAAKKIVELYLKKKDVGDGGGNRKMQSGELVESSGELFSGDLTRKKEKRMRFAPQPPEIIE